MYTVMQYKIINTYPYPFKYYVAFVKSVAFLFAFSLLYI